jgi:hypothetical protein
MGIFEKLHIMLAYGSRGCIGTVRAESLERVGATSRGILKSYKSRCHIVARPMENEDYYYIFLYPKHVPDNGSGLEIATN